MTQRGATVTVAWLAQQAVQEIDLFVDAHVAGIREEEPVYALVPSDELRADARELLLQALTSVAENSPVPAEAARRTALRRAEQRIPLGPMLHAFRLGNKAIWQRLLVLARAEGPGAQLNLLAGAESVWAVLDAFSSEVTTAYQEGLIALAHLDARRRLDALSALLEGRRADWALMSGTAAVLGLPQRATYSALTIELTLDAKLCTPEEVLRGRGVPCALRGASRHYEGIVALQGRQVLEDLVVQLESSLTGRVGLSEPYLDLAQTAEALREAEAAMRCLPAGSVGVARLSDDRLASLLTEVPDLSAATAGTFLGRLRESADSDILLGTLAAYFACGGVAAAATELFCHRNTVGRHLRRLEELTGRKLDDPRGTAELYIALRVHQLGLEHRHL